MSGKPRNKAPVPRNKPTPQKTTGTIQRIEGRSYYRGPVPPPEVLARLEEIIPGSAERILVMAEKDQESVHKMRENAHNLSAQLSKELHKENIHTLYIAFATCLFLSSLGAFLVINGHEVAGGALLGTTLVAVVTSFLRNSRNKPQEK